MFCEASLGEKMQKFLCIIVYWFIFFSLVAQDAVLPPQPVSAESDTVLANPEEALRLDSSPLENGGTVQMRQGYGSISALLLQLIVSIGVICAVVYGVLYLIKRSKQFNTGTDPFLKTAAVLPLAPDKTLYAVTLMNKAYLLGASASSLSLIAEIADKELVDAMNLYADQQQKNSKQDFSSVLYTFFPASRPKQQSEEPLDSFLSKQRERLQKNAAHTSDTAYTGDNEGQNK